MKKNFKHIDSWKNPEIFEKQFILNRKELDGKYPIHWNSFISALNKTEGGKILDVGCGVGSYYEICEKHFSNVEYYGCDYSSDAIDIAKKEFHKDRFFVANLFDLKKEDLEIYDIVHAGALLDLLPNADEGLESILSWGVQFVIIGRMRFTFGESFLREYKAYNLFDTYEYHINSGIFDSLIQKFNYKVIFDDENLSGAGQTLLLRKI